jgi:hypothetical protein
MYIRRLALAELPRSNPWPPLSFQMLLKTVNIGVFNEVVFVPTSENSSLKILPNPVAKLGQLKQESQGQPEHNRPSYSARTGYPGRNIQERICIFIYI